jgi:hypothetical protein
LLAERWGTKPRRWSSDRAGMRRKSTRQHDQPEMRRVAAGHGRRRADREQGGLVVDRREDLRRPDLGLVLEKDKF